jgi:fructokinase
MRIGVDLGGTKLEVVCLDDAGAQRLRRRVPTPRGDYAATLAAIRCAVLEAEREIGVRGTVGVGIPGSISPVTGCVRNANSTWLNGRPLQRDLEDALARPVRIENDANCLAVSEAADGAAAGRETVFAAILGTGVGGGLVAAGRLLRGANAVAGEWGHNPLPSPADEERPGPSCWCGRRGCIETWLSGPAFARDAGRRDADAAAAVAAMRAGDAGARAAFARYAERLARSLASVIDVFDPHAIVLGGGMSNVDELYDEVPRLWQRWVFSDAVRTPLLRSLHGDSSGVRGAAWLWPAGVSPPPGGPPAASAAGR